MSILGKLRLENSDLAQNPAIRLPVCLCIDASYSMHKHSRMLKVNRGIRRFLQEIGDNYYAVDSVELCIISFGAENAKIVQSFAPVTKIQFEDIPAGGKTPLGQAVLFALDELRSRKAKYESYGITTYKPWLILISDGAATDDTRTAVERILEVQKNQEIKVLCIGIGEEANDLEDFLIEGKVVQLKDFALDNFFAWLSKSMSKQSKESPGTDMGFPDLENLKNSESE